MLGALVQFVMGFMNLLLSGLFAPLLSLFGTLFPDVSTYFGYIFDYLGLALDYVTFMAGFVGFTTPMMQLLFNFFIIEYLVYVAFLGFRFIVNLYDKLKP